VHKRLDPRLALALRRMHVDSIADAWRALGPVANELGIRPPSYNATVRLVHAERRRRERLERARDAVLAAVIAGRVPTPYELERLVEALN